MKIVIELLSDTCIASGDGYNSVVDTDVVYDEHGLPYLPAKRVKGCIREAALELCDMDVISKEQYTSLFGREGHQNSAFWLSNAYLENYDLMCRELQAFSGELTSRQNVLEQFTYLRTQTAVDLKSGAAQENSLRTLRVVKKNLKFVAECGMYHEHDKDTLIKAVSIVKHMGMSRTRGLGLVRVRVLEDAEENRKNDPIAIPQSGDRYKIEYSIYLKSAMICKSAQGNQAVTQDYIAGSKVLGLLAGALGTEEYRELMAEDVKVANAYISTVNGRCLPGSASLQKEKDTFYGADGSVELTDMLYVEKLSGKQMSPAGIDYIDKEGYVTSVDTQITYHHQRPEDKSIGRATGNDDSSFYQLASIAPGQIFKGYILAGKAGAEKIVAALQSLKNVRMGYGKSSEFGAADISIDGVEPVCKTGKVRNDAVVELASDVILYNDAGMPVTDIPVLTEYLSRALGTPDIEITKPFLCFHTLGGFNVTWGCRKPVFQTLGMGSVFMVHSDSGFTVDATESIFLGERTGEGYGELVFSERKTDSRVKVWKQKELFKETTMPVGENSGIIDMLIFAEIKRQVTEAICSLVSKQHLGNNKKTLNAAIAKYRAIFKSTDSFAAMREQIGGIEDKEKQKLCNALNELVAPWEKEDLGQEKYKEVCRKYHREDAMQWSEADRYSYVYRVYLSELKHYVKSLDGGDEDE